VVGDVCSIVVTSVTVGLVELTDTVVDSSCAVVVFVVVVALVVVSSVGVVGAVVPLNI
jgi:hypothetical protein